MAQLLVARGARAPSNSSSSSSSSATAALLKAAREPTADCVAALLDAGVPVSSASSEGQTAAHTAAQHRARATLALLLQRGADVALLWKRDTPLHCAARAACAHCVSLLLAHGVDAHAVEDRIGSSELVRLCMVGEQGYSTSRWRTISRCMAKQATARLLLHAGAVFPYDMLRSKGSLANFAATLNVLYMEDLRAGAQLAQQLLRAHTRTVTGGVSCTTTAATAATPGAAAGSGSGSAAAAAAAAAAASTVRVRLVNTAVNTAVSSSAEQYAAAAAAAAGRVYELNVPLLRALLKAVGEGDAPVLMTMLAPADSSVWHSSAAGTSTSSSSSSSNSAVVELKYDGEWRASTQHYTLDPYKSVWCVRSRFNSLRSKIFNGITHISSSCY
jgi:ankyrin repeat protein